MDMEKNIRDIISKIFGDYDMRNTQNTKRMKRIFDFCMSDLEAHPMLKESLQTKEELEFFVMQSILYCIQI